MGYTNDLDNKTCEIEGAEYHIVDGSVGHVTGEAVEVLLYKD